MKTARKDKIYQYVCPVTGKPFYTGHSVDVGKRNCRHQKSLGLLGRKLRSYDPPLTPVIIAQFDTRVEAIDREVYHMFADHTWHTYGGLNYRIGDFHLNFEAQKCLNSRSMKRLMADDDFRKKQKAAVAEANSRPAVKANASKRMKALFADPEFRNRHSDRCRQRMCERWADPEYRAKQSERMKIFRSHQSVTERRAIS